MPTLTLQIKARTALARTFLDAQVVAATDTVTVAGHTLGNGDQVFFTNSGGTLPAGLTSRTIYFVVSATSNTFKVAATLAGAAVDITGASSGGTHTVTKALPFTDIVSAGLPKASLTNIINLLEGVQQGAYTASIDVHQTVEDSVAATGTITLATAAADDTVVIGGVTLTAKAAPANEAQFSQAGTDTQDAASLAAAINVHSVLGRHFIATSALGVVTVTSLVKGRLGNLIVMTKTGEPITLSAATLTGGTGGSQNVARTFGFGRS